MLLAVVEEERIHANGHRSEGYLASDRAEWFRGRLMAWWNEHNRDFPWRQTRDPYRILVAELMLRRTQARQVVPVYEHFVGRYPDLMALAAADDPDVARVLYPLGLAWRVGAFRGAAVQIVALHEGRVPSDRAALLALPGVGDYVADAVGCFAFDKSVALVDTNTVRLAGRFMGFPHTGDVRRLATVKQAIAGLVGPSETRHINLAMLDHAAHVCRSRVPRCRECPVSEHCMFFSSNGVLKVGNPVP